MENTVSLTEHATIANACNIKSILHESLNENASTIVDASGLVDVDLSFLQLMESARTFAKSAGKTLRLEIGSDSALTRLLERSGFLAAADCDDIQFWFHGALPK